MTLLSNKLQKQVDLPVWEWTRPLPVGATAALSGTCTADFSLFNENSGRYIYTLLNATNFWRYDTIADTYIQLCTPGITPLTATSLQFAGAQGYYGRVISSTSNTIFTGLPFGKQAIGYRIRIISGTGAGQERLITAVSDPFIADFGGATAGSTTALTDTNKNWGGVGATNNVNNWVGYVVRTIFGTGLNQVRKILYNSATVLTIADLNIYAYDSFAVPLQGGLAPTAGTIGWVSPAVATLYQIEASTITVDTAWTVQPDNTSRYVIQSGAVWLCSGAIVANGSISLQYYSVLEDIWYAKSVQSNMIPTLLTESSFQRLTENASIWYTGKASEGTVTTITDSNSNWVVNQWAGYKCFIWTGTGRDQIGLITSNTATVLTFSNTLSTAPDATSRYNIVGYDAGTLTSTSARAVFDSTKTWSVDRWKGYAIRIIAGTGNGQIRQIVSNGTTSIVVDNPWTVQPDNTSIYTIGPYSTDMFISLGANAELFLYHESECDMVSHNRPLDEGIVMGACAMLTDGTSTATHRIFDQKPVPITSIAGTTIITATTVQPHQFKASQWVSIRGVTTANDIFNVTGKVQIATVPSTTTFTYSPFANGSGTYQYSDNVTIGTTVLPDASKFHADSATGGSTTTATFSRAQPSNINGWYAYGTNIAAGAQVASGAGTTTLTLNLTGGGTPTGTIRFSKWPLPVSITGGGGGGAGIFTCTIGAALPAYAKGWLVTGTGIQIGTIVTGGEGTTTISLSLPCTGAVSGTLVFSNPLNNHLPVSSTYSSGSGSSITMNAATNSHITGWWVSGTNIANGTIVTGGAGTATITVSPPTSGTPSGTITFYPPSVAPAAIYLTTAAPALAATGLLATGSGMQLVAQNTSNGTVMIPISAVAAVAAGISRYVITRRDVFGQQYDQQNMYLSGTATSGSTTTLVDGAAFWATATGSGSAGSTTLTLSAIGSYVHNGWYVSGTGIAAGARIVSGGGTTSLVLDLPHTGAVSATMTITAWQPQHLVGRKLRILTGATGLNQDLAITAVTASSGTITFGTATAPVNNVSVYSVLPGITTGAGSKIVWKSNGTQPLNAGRFIFRVRGGATPGIDKYDITTDRLIPMYVSPFNETLSSGSQYCYDGFDRIYFTKDVTNRVYYLDTETNMIHGAGIIPYLAGTAGLGNLMEVITTVDGLKYIWVVRKANVETFRTLAFY
jgi:hypothetical protein